jgi:hypothetical protein
VLNVSKTHAMLISKRDRGVVTEHPLAVAGDVVVFSNSVKSPGLPFDNRLSCREQVRRVVSHTFSTLRLLYLFQRYTSRDLRFFLIIPIFLYTDVVFFSSLTGLEVRRLDLDFNACMRYVFGLRRFDHISEFSRGILGYTMFKFLELAFFIHNIGLVGAPSYFSSLLVLGRSSRQRCFTLPRPAPSTSLRGDSTFQKNQEVFGKIHIFMTFQHNLFKYWRSPDNLLKQ